MKTKREIVDKLLNMEIRMMTNSTDVNRPLCRDERDRNNGWVNALRWVLDETKQSTNRRKK